MSARHKNKPTLQLTEELAAAVITVGDDKANRPEKCNRDDASKPLYLKRI